MGTYVECGGTDMPEQTKVMVALKTFPLTTPSDILAPMRKATTYDELKHQIREEITLLDDLVQGASGALNFVLGR